MTDTEHLLSGTIHTHTDIMYFYASLNIFIVSHEKEIFSFRHPWMSSSVDKAVYHHFISSCGHSTMMQCVNYVVILSEWMMSVKVIKLLSLSIYRNGRKCSSMINRPFKSGDFRNRFTLLKAWFECDYFFPLLQQPLLKRIRLRNAYGFAPLCLAHLNSPWRPVSSPLWSCPFLRVAPYKCPLSFWRREFAAVVVVDSGDFGREMHAEKN